MTAIPRANPWLTGIAAIVSSALRLITMPKNYSVLRSLARKEESDIDRSDWVLLVVLPITVYFSFIAAGIGFLSGMAWAVPVLAASCLVLLLVSARGAWDTLVTIAVMMPSGQSGAGHEERGKES
jgi:uncharacterized membrane protein YgcG